MTKCLSWSRRPRKDEIDDLVSIYKQKRSIEELEPNATAHSSANLCSLNLSPWDGTLEHDILIKNDKEQVFDNRCLESLEHPSSINSLEYCDSTNPSLGFFQELRMDQIHVGARNSVCYSSIRIDAGAYEEQYFSLKAFLAACNSLYRKELYSIMFPVFVSFYVDLVLKAETAISQNFYSKFSCDHEEHHKDFVQALSAATTSSSIEASLPVKEFLEHKFPVRLSLPGYMYLLQHLRHGNYALVLQVINSKLSIVTASSSGSRLLNTEHDGKLLKDFEEYDEYSLCSVAEQSRVDDLRKAIDSLHSLKTSKPSICLYTYCNTYQGLCCSTFSHNGNLLCGGFEDSSIHLWSLTVKKLLTQRSGMLENSVQSDDALVLRGHSGAVYATAFFADGNALISASEDASVRLWSLQTCSSLVEYKGHSCSVWDVAVALEESYFASASLDRSLRLWNTEYAFPVRIFAGHSESVDCALFHPNGNYVASGSSDKSCRLWDIQTGQFVRVFVGHKGPIYALSFSPDGKYLASAGDDCSVFIWDLTSGKSLKELKGHRDTVCSVAFSRDGSMLASAGLDGSIKVWDGGRVSNAFEQDPVMSSSMARTDWDLLGSYPTKTSSIVNIKFSAGSLLLAAGVGEVK